MEIFPGIINIYFTFKKKCLLFSENFLISINYFLCMTPQFLSLARKHVFMCDPTHPTSKHVGIIIDVNRQELEQEVLRMVHAI